MRRSRGLLLRGGCVAASALLAAASPAAAQEKLVSEGDALKYFKGAEAPPPDWNAKGFDDSDWLDGQTPIGYGPDLPYATVLDDMQNSYFAVYDRLRFSVADPGQVTGLRMSIKYDDGLIAYLNGTEILRKSMPQGDVTKDTPATDHETNTTFEAAVLPCDAVEALEAGENVLAFEVHNATLASSDCALSVELETMPSACPTNFVCTVRTNADSTTSVLVRWSKPLGINYDSLVLLRNGSPLDPQPRANATSYTDRSPPPGDNTYKLVATLCGSECAGDGAPSCTVTIPGGVPMFRRGDTDQNGSLGINDAVLILNFLFRDGAAPGCPDSADVDDNMDLQLTDAVYLLRYQFQGGPAPPPPLEACGADPTADGLAPCTYAACP